MVAARKEAEYGFAMRVYRCPHCDQYHMARRLHLGQPILIVEHLRPQPQGGHVIINLMDHQADYVLRVLDARWAKCDKERGELPHKDPVYRQLLAEQARIEAIQQAIKDGER